MKLVFIVFCVFIGYLFFRPVQLPAALLSRICDRLAPAGCLVSCGSAEFGLRDGFRARGIRVTSLDAADSFAAAVSVQSLRVTLSRKVTVVGLVIPRLHKGYYEDAIPRERNNEVTFRFPALPDFDLELVRPVILGVAPECVTAIVRTCRESMRIADIRLDWPDQDRRMSLGGFCDIVLASDASASRRCRPHGRARPAGATGPAGAFVSGGVRGLARPSHIRPLLTALDLPSSYPYIDGFTKVTEPVPAACDWHVDLRTCDFRIALDLKPTLGQYNGVPLASASSGIGIAAGVRGTNFNYRVDVGPLDAVDLADRHFGGTLSVVGTNGVVDLLIDAKSDMKMQDTFDIIGYLNEGTLDSFKCADPPTVKASGMLAVGAARQSENNLVGSATLGRGVYFGIPMTDLAFDLRYRGDTVSFTNCVGHGAAGGTFTGDCAISVPDYEPERATFRSRTRSEGARLEQLAQSLGIDPDDRAGIYDATFEFSGPMATNLFKKGLCGKGNIRVRDGHLAQMRLFAGLTDLLAENVPGVSSIINQNEASCDFTVRDGVLSTDNLFIEGGLFSFKITGSYDLTADNLDFVLRVRFLRNKSLLGMLVHPVTWPFSKLLLEYRVTGPVADPKWKYINVLERVL